MKPALELHGVVVGFDAPIVGPIDVTLEVGQALAVLGANGCGKTTLLRTCLGLLPALSGRMLLAGSALPTAPQSRAKLMAYVPQTTSLTPGYSVREVVAFGRSMHLGLFGSLTATDHEAIDQALEATQITALAGRTIERLSGGEQQRVHIARALATGARLLLLDEPMNHLDLAQMARLAALLHRLKARGYSLVFTTHNPNDALDLADVAVLLARGASATAGPCGRVLTTAALSSVFGVTIDRREALAARL